MSLRMLRTPAFILSSTITIAVAAGAVLAIDARRAEDLRAGRTSRAFQRLTRGIGGGSAVDLGGCPQCFDPRLTSVCPYRFSPQPGGDMFCAEHSVATFVWPSARRHDAANSHFDSERVDKDRVNKGRVDSDRVDTDSVDSRDGDSEADDARHR